MFVVWPYPLQTQPLLDTCCFQPADRLPDGLEAHTTFNVTATCWTQSMQSVRLTLYDFFGYLLPGAIVVAALALFVWSVFFPTAPIFLTIPSRQLWAIGAV